MTSLVLIPLMAFAALAVDLGAWYNRISQLQKAADAAALAGVVWMPNSGTAQNVMWASLNSNGIYKTDTSITVTAGGSDNNFSVTIVDRNAPQFFSQIFTNQHTLTRSATATYNPPLSLGSPLNYFGGETLTNHGTYPDPSFWANIFGPGSQTGNGDGYSAACDKSGNNCSTVLDNYQYHQYHGSIGTSDLDNSYVYTIDVPKGASGPLDIKLFDAGYYPGATYTTNNLTVDQNYGSSASPGGDSDFHTIYQVYTPGPVPLDLSTYPKATSCAPGTSGDAALGVNSWDVTIGQYATQLKQKWDTICEIANPIPGARYLLAVRTTSLDGSKPYYGAGSNRYAVEADLAGLSGPVAGQPTLAAYNSMSMYNGTKTNQNFYLAKIGPEYAGKTLQVNMFDVGDMTGSGTATMELHAAYDASSASAGLVGSAIPKCSTITVERPPGRLPGSSVTSTLATNASCAVLTYLGPGQNPYNDEWLHMYVKIPSDYTCNPTTTLGCWWYMRYKLTGSAYGDDTTTWGASATGKPVHLTQ